MTAHEATAEVTRVFEGADAYSVTNALRDVARVIDEAGVGDDPILAINYTYLDEHVVNVVVSA